MPFIFRFGRHTYVIYECTNLEYSNLVEFLILSACHCKF